MARENQGLQIALIIFVVLTILLGVTSFLFFRNYQQAADQAAKATDEATRNMTAAQNTQTEANHYKEVIGYSASDKRDVIDQGWAADGTTYGADVDPSQRNYRKMLAHLHKVVETKDIALTDALAQVRQLQDTIASLEATKQPLIAAQEKRADDAEADRAEERQKHKTQYEAVVQGQSDLQKKLEVAYADRDRVVDDMQKKVEAANDRIKQLLVDIKIYSERVDETRPETRQMPDGQIRWVNQRSRTVWINLGQADALRRQTTFAVYPADATDLKEASSKGSVEVTQILGDHLAEARIVEDNITDPIMPGDLIHTVVWAPGRREHFALTDGIDLDGDGRSDVQAVMNIIQMNGGVVDAWLDDTGNLHGKLSAETDFLVLGSEPGMKATRERLDARSSMLRKAKELGIKVIGLQELLTRMGYRDQTPVVRFGPGGSPDSFPARPPEGIPRTSTGNVSPLFQPRQPPARSPAGAY
jgi:hypothetical protein